MLLALFLLLLSSIKSNFKTKSRPSTGTTFKNFQHKLMKSKCIFPRLKTLKTFQTYLQAYSLKQLSLIWFILIIRQTFFLNPDLILLFSNLRFPWHRMKFWNSTPVFQMPKDSIFHFSDVVTKECWGKYEYSFASLSSFLLSRWPTI